LNAELNYKDRLLTYFQALASQTPCFGFREVPGTAFDYNDATMGFFWDVLINRVYKTPWDRAEKEVFTRLISKPLGFEDGTPGILAREARKTGRFAVSARDFCRFGLLFLHQGTWANESVLDAKLAQMAVSDPLPLAIGRTEAKPAEACATKSIGGGTNQCDHNGGYRWL
jgi:CubicO group peptidase (beta-lactamase class C family)